MLDLKEELLKLMPKTNSFTESARWEGWQEARESMAVRSFCLLMWLSRCSFLTVKLLVRTQERCSPDGSSLDVTAEQWRTTPESARSLWSFFCSQTAVLTCSLSSPTSSFSSSGPPPLFCLLTVFFCFAAISYLPFHLLSNSLEELVAADCWAKMREVWVFTKLWGHLTFPPDGCKQAMTLAGEPWSRLSESSGVPILCKVLRFLLSPENCLKLK